MDQNEYLHQMPFEMWSMYVEGRREDVETICGQFIKPEIPLNDKKPRCPVCWPPREIRAPRPLLAKKFRSKPTVVEAIQVNPDNDHQIGKVLEWGALNGAQMAWFGGNVGLHVETANGSRFDVPPYDWLVKDLVGNITNLPAWLFWTMYEEEM